MKLQTDEEKCIHEEYSSVFNVLVFSMILEDETLGKY